MVYRYLISLCGNEYLAEELTQETFYQAIKSADRYNGSCSVSTWLCQIGKHMWLRELRRRKHLTDMEPDENMLIQAMTPEDSVLKKEQVINTMKRVHELPEAEREVVLLRAMGSLSFREIGEIMGRRESWARVTFFRAKQKLKEQEEQNG